MEKIETWRAVVGFEQFYEVSSLGRIRRKKNKRVRRPSVAHGYLRVTLSCRGNVSTKTVHSMVMEAFEGPRPMGAHVDHIDGDKTNNALTNLRYCTPQENEENKKERGMVAVGSRNGSAKLTDEAVLEICQARATGGRFWGLQEMAKKHGVDPTAIQRLFRRSAHPVIRRFHNNPTGV